MHLDAVPEPFVLTILHQIGMMLLAACNGDLKKARTAAAAALAMHVPRTEAELRYAVRIVSFSLQAGEALAQASGPNVQPRDAVRLRAGAVNLIREAQKAERQLVKERKTTAEWLGAAPPVPVAHPQAPHPQAPQPQAPHLQVQPPQASHLQAPHLQTQPPQAQQAQAHALRAHMASSKPHTTALKAQPTPLPLNLEEATAALNGTATIAAYAKAHGISWTKAMNERRRDQVLSERKVKKAMRAHRAAATQPAGSNP